MWIIALNIEAARRRLVYLKVSAWSPDECDRCESLKNMSVPDVEQRLQMPALLVSCFACTAGWATPAQQQILLKASHSELLEVADACAAQAQTAIAEHGDAADTFAPGPRAFADLLSPGSGD